MRTVGGKHTGPFTKLISNISVGRPYVRGKAQQNAAVMRILNFLLI